MPQFPEHDCRQQQHNSKNMVFQAQKPYLSSSKTASYMMPTESGRRRTLIPHVGRSTQRKVPTHSGNRVAVLRGLQSQVLSDSRQSTSVSLLTHSALKPSRSSSTFLFPNSHTLTTRAICPSTSVTITSKSEPGPVSASIVANDAPHHVDLEHIAIDSSDSQDDSDWLLDKIITTPVRHNHDEHTMPNFAASSSGATTSSPVQGAVTSEDSNEHTINNNKPLGRPSSSTAQLMRQCAHCKVLYYSAHACDKKEVTATRARGRPQTAPSGSHAVRSSLTVPIAVTNGGGTGKSHIMNRPLTSSGVCGSRRQRQQAARPSSASALQASELVAAKAMSVVESYSRASTTAGCVTKSFTIPYRYNTISSGSNWRPKSTTSSRRWRHRPPLSSSPSF